jgi:hypothetical protein
MKNNNKTFRSIAAFACLGGSLVLAGCGDDAPPPKPPQSTSVLDQPHTPVTETEHQIFERKYTEKCIKSQQASGESQLNSDQELGQVCQCMAQEISKRLTHADALHFNEKNEFPFELVMMTDAAANHCMAAKQ